MRCENVYGVLVQLAGTPSLNQKIQILKDHDGPTLRKVCRLATDPYTQFYIRQIPHYQAGSDGFADLWDVLHELDVLTDRLLTGHAARDHLANLFSKLHPDDALVLERVIQKDLRCGVSTSIINTVWPGLVTKYPCMLASAFSQKLVDKIPFPAIVQEKTDGMRFNAIILKGVCEFRTRTGKVIDIADPTLAEQFISAARGEDVVFDGELVLYVEGKLQDRKTGNGILNKAVKGTQSLSEGMGVRAVLWDVIDHAVFTNGKIVDYRDKIPYVERFIRLTHMVEEAGKHFISRLSVANTAVVESMEEVSDLFQQFLHIGSEGIILKASDMIWEDKRSRKQIKFKDAKECDLRCVGWIPGTGKHEGKMGALVLESEDKKVQVNVGTGFSDQDRETFTEEYCLGKIVTVKYNERIKDKRRNAYDSLFLPVFEELRLDKEVADSSSGVK